MGQMRSLLSGFTRWGMNPGWYIAAPFMILGPLAIALIYSALGNSPPGLRPGVTMSALLGITFFQFVSGPLAEEAGWRGFALP
ncbi:MAG: hypothetical protein ACM3XO_18430 [Bacteroidota bacterium]